MKSDVNKVKCGFNVRTNMTNYAYLVQIKFQRFQKQLNFISNFFSKSFQVFFEVSSLFDLPLIIASANDLNPVLGLLRKTNRLIRSFKCILVKSREILRDRLSSFYATSF